MPIPLYYYFLIPELKNNNKEELARSTFLHEEHKCSVVIRSDDPHQPFDLSILRSKIFTKIPTQSPKAFAFDVQKIKEVDSLFLKKGKSIKGIKQAVRTACLIPLILFPFFKKRESTSFIFCTSKANAFGLCVGIFVKIFERRMLKSKGWWGSSDLITTLHLCSSCKKVDLANSSLLLFFNSGIKK